MITTGRNFNKEDNETIETTMMVEIGTTTATVANAAVETVETTPNNRGPMDLDDSKDKNSVLGTNDPVISPTFKRIRGTLLEALKVKMPV